MPALPKKNGGYVNKIDIILKNELLNEEECRLISENPFHEVSVFFEGNEYVLNILFQQLAQFRTNPIRLIIDKCLINPKLCLPFDELNNRTTIEFHNGAQCGSGFNDYLMDCNDVIFSHAVKKISVEHSKRLIAEKEIRKKFLQELYNELDRINRNIDRLSNQQKMDFFFEYIRKSYPYDWSIVNLDGSWKSESTELGGTAKVVYERGKGICEGRSKLLKLVTNNSEIKLPCYIVSGRFINYGHAWNEFINDDGHVLEYDTSTGLKCSWEELQRNHPNYYNVSHEVPVERALKINKY